MAGREGGGGEVADRERMKKIETKEAEMIRQKVVLLSLVLVRAAAAVPERGKRCGWCGLCIALGIR